jgi:hypothetical protein
MICRHWDIPTFSGIRIEIDWSWFLIAFLLKANLFSFANQELSYTMRWTMEFWGALTYIVLQKLYHALISAFKLTAVMFTIHSNILAIKSLSILQNTNLFFVKDPLYRRVDHSARPL